MRLWLIVPLAAAALAQDPAQIFKATCAGCHGLDSMGGEHAPAINLGHPDTEILQSIQYGIPSSGMPAFGNKLTSEQIQNLITYLRRLQPIDTWLAVEAKLLFDLGPSEGSWPSYNGDYTGRRYSSLKQITPENISALRAQWVFHSHDSNRLEVTPLVVNRTMFVTSANDAFALDARTGRELWHISAPSPKA